MPLKFSGHWISRQATMAELKALRRGERLPITIAARKLASHGVGVQICAPNGKVIYTRKPEFKTPRIYYSRTGKRVKRSFGQDSGHWKKVQSHVGPLNATRLRWISDEREQ